MAINDANTGEATRRLAGRITISHHEYLIQQKIIDMMNTNPVIIS